MLARCRWWVDEWVSRYCSMSVNVEFVKRRADACASTVEPAREPVWFRPVQFTKSVRDFLYGKPPAEQLQEWQRKVAREQRQLDKEIRELTVGQQKVRADVKRLATKGDLKNARVLAREVVRSNKQVDRLHTSKARLKSVGMQLTHQSAMLKVTGSLQKSTEIMKLTNQLVKLPELSAAMRQMSMEMTKAGIMEEMMDDTLESLDEDQEELDEEADAEVDKVLYDLTGLDTLAGKQVGTGLPTNKVAAEKEDDEAEAEMQRMQRELQDLLSN
ncbi:Vacuolar sorting protein VPS24 [Phaffia rhodozyma]|uniref:Vacuolar sorting protein VPS24 n=1 Tax=Phaffia rhodozyma TaxID=264483 RepID=A0A0F7SK12_PHARH|nr:Vacuolar sorting protein VPS24 [Phaffia rhodozyma]